MIAPQVLEQPALCAMDRVPPSPRRDDPKKRRVEGPTNSQTRGTHQHAASVTGKLAPRKKDLFKTP